jgi:DNA primase
MPNYIIKKKNKNNEIVYMEYGLPGYVFVPKNKVAYLNVKNVRVVDNKLTDVILTTKFEEMFKKLMKITNRVLNDEDAGSDDTALALDEVTLIREILLNKYQQFLNKDKEALFLKKLRVVENEIRIKEMQIQRNLLVAPLETKGKAR